jgi:hypothetical protein
VIAAIRDLVPERAAPVDTAGRCTPRASLSGVLLALLLSAPAAAQHEHHDAESRTAPTGGWGVQAVGLLTHATPALFGRDLMEAYLTQPALMGHLDLAGGRLNLQGMLNFEGITLQRGELNAGIWGEGYIDRRHPHTFLHEVMATGRLAGGPHARAELTLAAGKGFAAFGTDDPMVRPFVKYPINHHLAQVLERLVAIAALRYGLVIVETSLFNGDEPSNPSHFATPGRFGDSWSVRGTLLPQPGWEAQASYAMLASPEFPAGSGLDHRKWSTALRYERAAGHAGGAAGEYALLEWARTDEFSGDLRSFRFTSLLGEAALRRRGAEVALRYERTVRPEEERLLDPFRSPRPHADANILGATRWQAFSVRLGRAAHPGRFGVAPFVEVSRLYAAETIRPSVFVPAEFYGSDRMWSFSAGMRLEAGTAHRRMGRYGAALPQRHPVAP